MTINLSVPEPAELHPRITVVGVGGAGGNAVNNMIDAQLGGVDFVVLNTDAQSLAQSLTDRRIQLGVNVTQGLGAGSDPDTGLRAAEESLQEIMEELAGSHMVFITAGMGGGTGSGASPLVAKAAREAGILTIGVVTKPFQFEGAHRMAIADAGTKSLASCVDTLIIIPNQNLFRVANDKTTFADAFKMADDVLYSGVRSVTDLMVMPGLINLDFADVRSIMMQMGKAMMGTGESDGERRAIEAAEAAIANPLLDDISMKGAKGVLINITGGPDMTLYEVDEAANRIRDEVDPDANIIFGSIFDPELEGRLRVSVVATGIECEQIIPHRVHTLYPQIAQSRNSDLEEAIQNMPARQDLGLGADHLPGGGSSLGTSPTAELETKPAPSPSGYSVTATMQGAYTEASTIGNTALDESSELLEQASSNVVSEPAHAQNASIDTPVYKPSYPLAETATAGPTTQLAYAETPSIGDSVPEGLSAPIERSNVAVVEESVPTGSAAASLPAQSSKDAEATLEKSFLPPPAAKLNRQRHALGQPDPFAEAAVANAGSGLPKRKFSGPSLFERVSGVGRRRSESQAPSKQVIPEETAQADNGDGRVEPRLGAQVAVENKTEMEANAASTSELQGSGTTSSHVVTEEGEGVSTKSSTKVSAPSSDLAGGEFESEPNADLLEIPAFLRRQAN